MSFIVDVLEVEQNGSVSGTISVAGEVRIKQDDNTFTDVSPLVHAASMGMMRGGEITVVSGFTVEVASGVGYTNDADADIRDLKKHEWSTQQAVLSASQNVYLYFDSATTLQSSVSFPETIENVLLGRVVTNTSGVELIDQIPVRSAYAENRGDRTWRFGIGPIYRSGSIVSETGVRKLNVTAGEYYLSLNKFLPVGGSAITFNAFRRDGVGGFIKASTDTVDNANFDDGTGTLAALGAGKFAKHSLYTVGQGVNEQYFLVYSQVQYDGIVLAEDGNIPSPPPWFSDGVVLIATTVVQQGVSGIVSIQDERPVIGFQASATSSASDHGNLLGLGDDDHAQYLLVNGTRAMTGDLDMGTNDIANVGTVDGVDVSAHASRHLPSGADPITTGTAVEITDSTNSAGTANSLARSDHQHAHGSRGGGTLHDAATTVVAGFMSSADKTKLDGLPTSAVPTSRTLTAGAGLTGGGDLSADRTFDVGANADGSIVVNANDVQVGVLATDAQHGVRGGGTQHALATVSTAGFMSAADKAKTDASLTIKSGTVSAGTFAGNPKIAAVAFGTAFSSTAYAITIVGVDARTWSYESKTTGGFTINSNANLALTGEVSWHAIPSGESG